ncbi:MAG: hypothetical protein DRJ03_02505 [Chloroflexi bacterium]|nr:MAG: hypothetical protein DRJ03_02505 [Chloroflexota bacterium]
MATKDQWIQSAVHEFISVFPVGTVLTAKELGEWMVGVGGVGAPDTVDPITRGNEPTWIKYIRDRAALRGQMNRFAMSQVFAAEHDTPYEIQHIRGEEYQVCSVSEDIKKLMRDLLERTKSGFRRKSNKIKRLHTIAETQLLEPARIIQLERMKEDLVDTEGDVTRILLKAIRMLNRCDQDFVTMSAVGITNGDNEQALLTDQ